MWRQSALCAKMESTGRLHSKIYSKNFMEHLRCVVERITYQNEENGYAVIKCRAKNYNDLVAVVGLMPDVHVGSVLSLEGNWRVDSKYGRQFSVEKFEETLPATVYGIEKYLGSGLIKGIGPKFAKRIVTKFGKDTLDIIEEAPDQLIEVEGIGQVRVERIKKSWAEQRMIKNIMLFLQSHDVTTTHATKIYKAYGEESIDIVQENPYRMADDIWGIGFVTADTIAEKMGYGHEKYARIRAGISYTLNKLSEDGHCYANWDQLVEKASELLDVGQEYITITMDEMRRANELIIEKNDSLKTATSLDGSDVVVYLPPFFFSERGTANHLKKLLLNEAGIKINTDGLPERISIETGMTYDEIQMQAIISAVTNKVFVLTGGPGTGKTTTTLGIITAFRDAGARILLAAPTGRAAKRLSESTGMEAKTIHRLLEVKPPEGYQRNEENPLEADVLIVDECSMIDIMLMYNLLKAIPDEMTLILVGDVDQLPSVGAGNVLKDILSSGAIPSVKLERIFRQAAGSRIITNAHKINKGKPIDIRGGKDSDFFFIEKDEQEAVVDLIVKYCRVNLPKYYGVSPLTDIQVLTPMQRGLVGAVNLNQRLQESLNPTNISLRRGGVEYRLHDKVMQIRNDYDKDVFNGDIGFISAVDMEERELKVNFDGREVTYDATELDELVLAYACTIHKSQGSEYPIVVMPFMMSHYIMLQRNLLYTGVTRAKKVLVLIGEKKAVNYAIHNNVAISRNTRLAERLTTIEAPRMDDGDEEWLSIDLFERINRSKFRSRFHLTPEDKAFVNEKGMDTIKFHAMDFVKQRLASAYPKNDGKQTPMRGHPIFIGQHATGTCCRGCLAKWHGIVQGKALSEDEQEYIVDVLMEWVKREVEG